MIPAQSVLLVLLVLKAHGVQQAQGVLLVQSVLLVLLVHKAHRV